MEGNGGRLSSHRIMSNRCKDGQLMEIAWQCELSFIIYLSR